MCSRILFWIWCFYCWQCGEFVECHVEWVQQSFNSIGSNSYHVRERGWIEIHSTRNRIVSVLCNSICDLAHLEFCDKYWTLHVENDPEEKSTVFPGVTSSHGINGSHVVLRVYRWGTGVLWISGGKRIGPAWFHHHDIIQEARSLSLYKYI